MLLPPLSDQAERLIDLGVHEHAGVSARELRSVAASFGEPGLLVTEAPASALAPLLRLGGRPGFVVEDMVDVDEFVPVGAALPPASVHLVLDPQRGDEFRGRRPSEVEPLLQTGGRTPLTIVEGLHWALVEPTLLERNHCFMTIGSRKPRAGGFDARTPALWISNGSGRDGAERRGAAKVGWCWWRNHHTWLGIASAARRIGPEV